MSKFRRNYKLGDVLKVYWIDASTDEDWQYIKDINKDAVRVQTVGFYLDTTKEAIIIGRSLSDDAGLEGKFNIPWVMVEKIRKMRE